MKQPAHPQRLQPRRLGIHTCLKLSIRLLPATAALVAAQKPYASPSRHHRRILNPPIIGHTDPSAALKPASSPPHPSSTSNPSKKHHHHHHKGSGGEQVNFYYIGVACFSLLLAFCLWLFHVRRRRRKMAQMRDAGQDALARDIDGMPYPNNRRWAGGARRGGGGFFTTRDEGLDERGEAPPPYKSSGPSEGATILVGPGVAGAPAYEGSSADAGVSIPLQTFHRDTPHPKPPEYHQESRRSSEAQSGLQYEQSSTDDPTSLEQSAPRVSVDESSGQQVNGLDRTAAD